jgi:peptidoglycan/LPS O-acetylase OafA/YrhL
LVNGFFGWVTSFGAYGATMFFVLSGFLITGILLDTKGPNGHFSCIGV